MVESQIQTCRLSPCRPDWLTSEFSCLEAWELGKDLKLKILGQRHTTESNGRSATFEVWRRRVFLVGTRTSLVEICHQHGTQGHEKVKINKNNISQTCTISLWVCCWHMLHKSLHVLTQSYNWTTTQTLQDDLMLQQQWPWLTPSGRPPAMSAASHLFIKYTLLLYLTSKIVTPCWCTSVVYHFFLF